MGYYLVQMEENMKVNLKMTKKKDMEQNIIQMEVNMKASLKMIKLKDMEYIIFLI